MKFKILIWIIVILVLSSFASAIEFSNSHGKSLSSQATVTATYGFKITALATTTITKLIKDASCTATKCRIYNDDGVFVAVGDYVGNNCSISVPIVQGTSYWVYADSNGSSYTLRYLTSATFPVSSSAISWISGASSNPFNTVQANDWDNIVTVVTDNVTYVPPDGINISTNFPRYLNLTYNTINFSMEINNTYTVECSLVVNSTVRQSGSVGAGSTSLNLNFTQTIGDGSWNYSINCIQYNDTSQNETTATYPFYVDATLPTLTTNFTSGTFIRMGNNLSMNFTFMDNLLLWGYNITINNFNVSTKTDLQSKRNESIITNSSWNLGSNTIQAIFWDAHTALETTIKADDLRQIGDSLRVKDTLATSLTAVDKITYTKNIDRYNFCYYYKTSITTTQIHMPDDCYYQNRDDLYPAWFVCPGSQWWDFANNGSYKISVKDNVITTETIDGKPTDKFCFNSVGSLNEVNVNYTVWGFNDTTNYNNARIEGVSTTFKLILESMNSSYLSSANLMYNNTYYTTTETNGTNQRNYTVTITTPVVNADTNISWLFNYSINGYLYNTTLTNQTVYNVNLTNCSTITTRALNFSFYNTTGTTNTLVDATMVGNVITDLYGSYNLSWESSTNSSICINPSGASTVVTSQYQFTIPGCGTRNYYLDTTLSNATQNINLYCDSGTTQVTFNVKDENDDDVSNVFIYIQKYDVGTNTATTTEIIKTDTNGQAVGNIIKFTQPYKFILIYNGVVVLEESPQYIMLDSKTFRINLGASTYFTNFDIVQGVTCSDVSFTNSTTSFSYTWLDPTGNVTQACLEVYLQSNTASTLVNSSCSSSAGGTLTVIIPPPVGSNSYVATGSIYIGSNKFVCGTSKSASFDVGWKDYKNEGLFLSFLLIVFLITVGLWNPVVAIFLMMIGIVLLNILGLFHLGWEWLVGFVLLGGIVMWKMRQN